MAPVLESIKDPALKQTLGHGVGFVHPGLAKSDRERVEALYRDGVILVVVVPASYCWSLELTAMLVVIMGTETYDGREHRYVDYPVTDMLQMIGKAGRPLTDASGKCVVLCHTPKKSTSNACFTSLCRWNRTSITSCTITSMQRSSRRRSRTSSMPSITSPGRSTTGGWHRTPTTTT